MGAYEGVLLWCPHSQHPGCAQPAVPRLGQTHVGQGALDTMLCWAESPHTHCTVSQPESIMQSIPSTFGIPGATKSTYPCILTLSHAHVPHQPHPHSRCGC